MTSAEQAEPAPRVKQLTVIVNDQDADRVLHALIDAGWPATKIASSGGFLRRSSATIMLGVPADEVESVIALIKSLSASRVEQVKVRPPAGLPLFSGSAPEGQLVDVRVGGAVIFVIDVERFERI
jgi:uncharacterized protein YaaQ